MAFAIALGILVNFSKVIDVFSKDSEKEKMELYNIMQQIENQSYEQEAVSAYIDQLKQRGEEFAEAAKSESTYAKEEAENSSEDDNPDDVLTPYEVVRVVDGDTIIVSDGMEDIRVRFIGVNCPESGTVDGEQATAFTEKMLSGKTVYLQCDSANMYDKYDRLLAYLWLNSEVDVNNTDDMVDYMYNCILLTSGYADVMIVDNDRYSDVFIRLQQVREQAVGNPNS